ncbi:MAG: hypothetical protein AAF438_15315, partial [Pseudomonadota bacterium]
MADKQNRSLISELKRRNVFRVAVAYVLVAWVVLQIADVLFPALVLPDWSVRLVAGILILGFPIALVMAWAYELTPDGLKRDADSGEGQSSLADNRRSLDKIIIVLLVLALLGFGLDRFVWQPGSEQVNDSLVKESQATENSIAVLAFRNTSPDKDQEYFADGLSEELLSALARVKQLRVIGRTSSFQFKNKDVDAQDIGEKLGIAHFLEGDVRRAGDRLRVTARLISTKDGVAVWTEVYENTLDDIFVVQDSIARAVAEALATELLGEVKVASASPREIMAYDLYLKGLQRRHMRDRESSAEASELMEQAVELDPELAQAWQQLAELYGNQTTLGVFAPTQGVALANSAVERALIADPQLASAYTTQGTLRMSFAWDWRGAEISYSRALTLDPSDSTALSRIATLEAAQGRFTAAQDHIAQAVRVDPLNLGALHNQAFVHYLSSDFDKAIEGFQYALEFAGGNYPIGHTMLALSFLGAGDAEQALVASEKELNTQFKDLVQVPVYYALGDQTLAQDMLRGISENYGDRAAVPIAGAHAFMG